GALKFPSTFSSAVFALVFILGASLAAGFAKSQILSTLLNTTTLNGVTFQSKVDTLDLAVIYITNLIACSSTFGLLLPWALIRLQKYKLSHIYVNASEETINNFVAGASQNISGAADAAVDF